MNGAERPLVTIVTPCYNQGHFIEETIQSVIAQDYQPIEHIVIDGGSTDGTLAIVQQYQDRLTWVSEPDRGQADAINKGFRRAHGTIMSWLNADDLLAPGAIRTVVDFFQANPQVSLVYGDALAIDERGQSFGRRSNVRPCDFESLLTQGDFIVQPAAFWRAELWRTVGELDEGWRCVLDYEYWIRAAQHYDLVYLPQCLALERLHASAISFSSGVERIVELEEMPRRFGGQGVPWRFRSEGTAVYLVQGWNELRHGRWAAARSNFRKGLQLRGSFFKTSLYLVTILLFGEARVPGWRLIMNRLRGLFPRGNKQIAS